MTKVVFYCICGIMVILGVAYSEAFIYALFVLLSFYDVVRKRKEGNYSHADIWLMVTSYSIILPDNYSTGVFFIVCFFFAYVKGAKIRIKKNAYSRTYLCFMLLAIISSAINMVPTVNVFFSIVSFTPFLMFLIMIKSQDNSFVVKRECIDHVLYIELLATAVNWILNRNSYGEDWSCGTLGRTGGQHAQLFIISAFLTIYYLYRYKEKKDTIDLVKALVALVIMLSTNCWVLLTVFTIGIALSYIATLTPYKVVLSVFVIILIPLLARNVVRIIPDNVSYSVKRMMTDTTYFRYRFYKAALYEKTFLEIPKNDVKFALIGNGVGYYNSRAALTCTGEYIDMYNYFFSPSVSEYTKEYIFDHLQLAKEHGESDYGSVLSRPYSSITSLMGECGYFGIILFLLLMGLALKNRHPAVKSIIIIWLCFCTAENYFEYPKILFLANACLLLINNVQTNTKLCVTESEEEKTQRGL